MSELYTGLGVTHSASRRRFVSLFLLNCITLPKMKVLSSFSHPHVIPKTFVHLLDTKKDIFLLIFPHHLYTSIQRERKNSLAV